MAILKYRQTFCLYGYYTNESYSGTDQSLLKHRRRATQLLAPLQVASEFGKKKTAMIRQAEQDAHFRDPAYTVTLLSLQRNSLLFNKVAGQVEVLAGQVNFRASFPRTARDVLEPMFHPDSLLTHEY